jgi:hypothetical protein
VHDYAAPVSDLDGHAYRAAALGERRPDGTWIGWLEFVPDTGGGVVWRTPRETTQSNLAALIYWSLGLEGVYLEGALERAIVARTLAAEQAPPRP